MLESSFNREARSLHSTAILCPSSSRVPRLSTGPLSLFWNISLRNSSCSGRIRFATLVELHLQSSHESLSRFNRPILLITQSPEARSKSTCFAANTIWCRRSPSSPSFPPFPGATWPAHRIRLKPSLAAISRSYRSSPSFLASRRLSS